MNRQRLQQIFANYIEKFELITNETYDENYKWRIAYQFHELMNPDTPYFYERMKQAWKLSANLIDSSNRYCFSALISCAEKEPETVRLLFKALFADDSGDLMVRQQKIQRFIEDANALTMRLHTTNGMFMNDQRSAMGYLFLYDPDNHYLYKASEANNFASCIEFYDDWGSGTNFKLDVYYRMCDILVEEIRKSPALLSTNESRFYDKNGRKIEGMHPDYNFHILAFDIIYGAPEFRYNFYKGIPFSNITAQARSLHEEKVKKAQELHTKWQCARMRADLLAEAKEYFANHIVVGLKVKHRTLGEGHITELPDGNMFIFFSKINETKKFCIMNKVTWNYLTADIPGFDEKLARYRDVIEKELLISMELDKAEQAFEPYRAYLE